MLIRTTADLGALIRDRRRRLGLDQRTLAERVGVSRQWVVAVEKGKPRAAIGLVLCTLHVLGIPLAPVPHGSASVRKSASVVDIDAIVNASRRKR